jgi:hypothetical protein
MKTGVLVGYKKTVPEKETAVPSTRKIYYPGPFGGVKPASGLFPENHRP